MAAFAIATADADADAAAEPGRPEVLEEEVVAALGETTGRATDRVFLFGCADVFAADLRAESTWAGLGLALASSWFCTTYTTEALTVRKFKKIYEANRKDIPSGEEFGNKVV